ncbi:unnamed protein product [Amoebophrya sp. A25]|nr:unnamed protein product [Amoebophrya sp. A25]|eukprot:GSA25T00026562001.1
MSCRNGDHVHVDDADEKKSWSSTSSGDASAWMVTGDVVTPYSPQRLNPIGIPDCEAALHNNIVLTTSGTATNAMGRSDIHIIVEHAGLKKVYDVTDYTCWSIPVT